jgi:hypothetical protein
VALALSVPVDCEPAVGSLPVQAPEAVQVVAFVDDHCSIALVLLATVPGLAEIVTVGAGVVPNTVVVFVAGSTVPPPQAASTANAANPKAQRTKGKAVPGQQLRPANFIIMPLSIGISCYPLHIMQGALVITLTMDDPSVLQACQPVAIRAHLHENVPV